MRISLHQRQTQRGMVLLVSLVFLLLLTLIGLSSMQSANLQEKMAGSVSLRNQSFQAAEAALRVSEEKFRAYVEKAADALFVHDDTGRILDVNRQACVSLGYSREELLAMRVFDIDREADPVPTRAAWAQITPDVVRTLQGRHRRKDGTQFPVEVRL